MGDSAQRQPSLPSLVIRNPNFLCLWAAAAIAAVGDHLNEMALLQERRALDSDRSVRIQALLTFAFFLPYAVLGPLAGWWADRFSRKWTMISSDLLRGVVAFNLSLLVPALAAWLDPLGVGDYSIVLPLMMIGLFASFFSPCRQALLPTLIREDQLVRANALISAAVTISGIFSYLLGGWIVKHLGVLWNYRLGAVTFASSAALISLINLRRARVADRPRLTGVWTPIRQGFAYVRRHRRALQMILLGTVFWGAAGVVISIIPAMVKDVFRGDIADIGVYRGLLGLGLVLGAAVMTMIGPAMPIKTAVLASLAGSATWLVLLDIAYVFRLGRFIPGLCLVGLGGAGAALLVTIMSTIQRFVPDSRRGRVFGVSDMATMAATVATTGLLGLPEIPHLDRYVPFLLGATALALFVALALAWREYRKTEIESPLLSIVWQIVHTYAYSWCGLKRIGPMTVPLRGPVLLAANHTSGIDPMALQGALRHRIISYLVAKEWYENPLVGWVIQMVRSVPVDRAKPGLQFFRNCLQCLRDGNCLLVFPAGGFGEVSDQPEYKDGLALIALKSDAPVIPVHISGTRYSKHPLACYFVRHRSRVRFGKPIDLSAYRGREKDREVLRAVTRLIVQRIEELAPDAQARENSVASPTAAAAST
ncbi:MAG: MFS transporter [Phycisphaerae bacterium]|jgi:1-acyl-sn-glycerol-3-phosphate acyltransferase